MYDLDTRNRVIAECREGRPYPEISQKYGVPRGTIGYWAMLDRNRRGIEPVPVLCRCTGAAVNQAQYSYLLGLYLGDGHIVDKEGQHDLTLYCGDTWPGLIDAAEAAMKAMPMARSVIRVKRAGCTGVKSSGAHWVCLFPQHGPGHKHAREIALQPWQQEIVDAHPWGLVRGLIHSDGCRITNWTVTRGRRYEYPRYFFTNKSEDIRRIMTRTLDSLGVEWKETKRRKDPYTIWDISIAKRASVELMDAHVGPKH